MPTSVLRTSLGITSRTSKDSDENQPLVDKRLQRAQLNAQYFIAYLKYRLALGIYQRSREP